MFDGMRDHKTISSPLSVSVMESGREPLYLNTPLGVTETSQDTSEKKRPVWNVTLGVGELTFWITSPSLT